MTSPEAVYHDKSIRTRSDAVASVIQDMGSSRLRILSDLMDSRKRAEAHEQEFLRTIHSENAAFSQIVSMFETHLREMKLSTENNITACMERVTSIKTDVGPQIRAECMADVSLEVSKLAKDIKSISGEFGEVRDELTKVAGSYESEVSGMNQRIESLRIDISSILNEKLIPIERSVADLSESILATDNNLGQLASTMESRIGLIEDRISEKLESMISSRIAESQEQILTKLESLVNSKLSEVQDECRVRLEDLESLLRSEIDSKLNEESLFPLEQRLVSTIKDEVSAARQNLISEKLDTHEQYVSSRIEVLESHVQSCLEMSTAKHSESALLPVISNQVISHVTPIAEQLVALTANLNARLAQQETLILSVASAGYFHEWTIDVSKLTSNTPYVSSDVFSVGPYSNLQLRLFPGTDSEDSQSSTTTVWLIHLQNNNHLSLPVFVDLAIGQSKRAMCRMKKVPELFGHWVWEANQFPHNVIKTESNPKIGLTSTVTVSVEISMRQWMRDVVPMEPEILAPNSPASSSFTFLPLASTNPFEGLNSNGATTPRRESWAKFGQDEPTNPFRH